MVWFVFKSSFRRNSVTYGTPHHAIGHFVFWYCECYGFERTFYGFLLSGIFYLTLLPGFYGAGSSSSKLAGLHADLRNIVPAQLFFWITKIHKRGIVVGSVYGLQLAGYVKNLLLTGFELFWRQAVYIQNCMAYLLGHRAIHSEIN